MNANPASVGVETIDAAGKSLSALANKLPGTPELSSNIESLTLSEGEPEAMLSFKVTQHILAVTDGWKDWASLLCTDVSPPKGIPLS